MRNIARQCIPWTTHAEKEHINNRRNKSHAMPSANWPGAKRRLATMTVKESTEVWRVVTPSKCAIGQLVRPETHPWPATAGLKISTKYCTKNYSRCTSTAPATKSAPPGPQNVVPARSTLYHACRKTYSSRSTRYCACHEIAPAAKSALQGSQRAAAPPR